MNFYLKHCFQFTGKQAPSRGTSQGSLASGPRQYQPPSAPAIADNGSGETEPMNAEQLWAQKAKNLASSKGRKLASQQQKTGAKRGVPGSRRDSSVNGVGNASGAPSQPQSAAPVSQYAQPPQAPIANGQPPPLYQSQQPPQHQWQQVHNHSHPASAQVQPIGPTPGGSQPIKHTVYTDDGQRVSVDINLKMMSPDGSRGHPPLPPPQSGQQNFAHAQQQPAYTMGGAALTQQNVSSQYGPPRAPHGAYSEPLHVQSVTTSASSAGHGDHHQQLHNQFRQSNVQSQRTQGGPQYAHPSQPQGPPQQGGVPLGVHAHHPQQQQQHAGYQYGLPRQPEGAALVAPAQSQQNGGDYHQQQQQAMLARSQMGPQGTTGAPQQVAPSQDPRFQMHHQQPPSLRSGQPAKQGFTKYGSRPPPVQPIQAFEHVAAPQVRRCDALFYHIQLH